jgi:hypothetical protein
MSRVIVQIGYVKNKKKMQSIKAYFNDTLLDWSNFSGKFLTTHKDRVYRNMVWYLCEISTADLDIIKLSVKTFLPGIGLDEENTFEALYCCHNEYEVQTIDFSNIGMKKYPLLKGRVLEVGSVSEEDKRIIDIDDFLNDVF